MNIQRSKVHTDTELGQGYGSSVHPGSHRLATTTPERHGADSWLPLHAAVAAWLSLALVVVPPEEAPAGKRSGLRAREGDDQSESAGEQPSRARTHHRFVHHSFAQARGKNSTLAYGQGQRSHVWGGQKQAAALICAVPAKRGRDALCPAAALICQVRRLSTAPLTQAALGLPLAALPCR